MRSVDLWTANGCLFGFKVNIKSAYFLFHNVWLIKSKSICHFQTKYPKPILCAIWWMDGRTNWLSKYLTNLLTDLSVVCCSQIIQKYLTDFQPISRRILWLISFPWQFSNSSLGSMMPEDLCTKGEPEGQKLKHQVFFFPFWIFIKWKSQWVSSGFILFYPFLPSESFPWKNDRSTWTDSVSRKLNCARGAQCLMHRKPWSTHFSWIFVWILPYCSYRFCDFLIIFPFFGNLWVMSSHPNWWIRLRNEVLEAKPERFSWFLGNGRKNLAQ